MGAQRKKTEKKRRKVAVRMELTAAVLIRDLVLEVVTDGNAMRTKVWRAHMSVLEALIAMDRAVTRTRSRS